MFGHLKAEDFISLIEDTELSLKDPGSQAHLQSCARCMDAFISAQELHGELRRSALDEDEIPEPDWSQFRADVRNSMLSRVAQRQSGVRSWSAWLLRPALTWGLAVAFAAGLSAGLLIWNRTGTVPSPHPGVESALTTEGSLAEISGDIALDTAGLDTELSASQTSVFNELSQLNDAQSEKLQRLLDAEATVMSK